MTTELFLRAGSHSILNRLIYGYCFQMLLRDTIQNQNGALPRSVGEKPIKLRPLIHIVCTFVLYDNLSEENHSFVAEYHILGQSFVAKELKINSITMRKIAELITEFCDLYSQSVVLDNILIKSHP